MSVLLVNVRNLIECACVAREEDVFQSLLVHLALVVFDARVVIVVDGDGLLLVVHARRDEAAIGRVWVPQRADAVPVRERSVEAIER